MRKLLILLLISTGCQGGSKESHSNSVDSHSVTINACNEDGTVNDQSTNEELADATELPTSDSGIVAESAGVVGTSPQLENVSGIGGGLSPVVPNDGIGVIKRSVLEIGQAEECEENKLCRILATDGVKASVVHCGGDVSINVMLPKE